MVASYLPIRILAKGIPSPAPARCCQLRAEIVRRSVRPRLSCALSTRRRVDGRGRLRIVYLGDGAPASPSYLLDLAGTAEFLKTLVYPRAAHTGDLHEIADVDPVVWGRSQRDRQGLLGLPCDAVAGIPRRWALPCSARLSASRVPPVRRRRQRRAGAVGCVSFGGVLHALIVE
jgi:hypothetical protein